MIKRVTQEFEKYTKDEKITVENIGGAYYAFGSELATLRLLKAYRNTKTARQDWSENLGEWYFVLETSF